MQLNRAMGAIPALVGDQGGKAVDCNYLCFSIWNSFSKFILDGIFLYIFGGLAADASLGSRLHPPAQPTYKSNSSNRDWP